MRSSTKVKMGQNWEVIYRHYCLFKNLYLEQCCWHLENVGPHSQYFDLVVTYRLHCAKDHTVEAALMEGRSTQSNQPTNI